MGQRSLEHLGDFAGFRARLKRRADPRQNRGHDETCNGFMRGHRAQNLDIGTIQRDLLFGLAQRRRDHIRIPFVLLTTRKGNLTGMMLERGRPFCQDHLHPEGPRDQRHKHARRPKTTTFGQDNIRVQVKIRRGPPFAAQRLDHMRQRIGRDGVIGHPRPPLWHRSPAFSDRERNEPHNTDNRP